jgi:hypothetical protein
MSEFPALKTGAVLQYPAEKRLRFSTMAVRFVDGSTQTFRDRKAVLRRWAVRLDLLTEEEMATLESFFVSQQGRQGTFEFTDPWDGVAYPSCSFDTDEAVFSLHDHARVSTLLWVRQNWS